MFQYIRLVFSFVTLASGGFFFMFSTAHAAVEPVAYWKFDETTSGGEAVDSSANDYHGTPSGVGGPQATTTVTAPTDFPNPASIYFDGTDDFLDLPDGFADFTQGMTVTLWARPTAVKNWGRFFDFGNGDAADNIIIAREGSSNDFYYETYREDQTIKVDATEPIALNEWHYYTVTVDPQEDGIHATTTIYVDGVEDVSEIAYIPRNIERTENFIAKSNWGSDDYYEGYIDDLRIYNVALTPEEVEALSAGEEINPPAIQSFSPTDGAEDVSINPALNIVFNKPVTTVTEDAITVRKMADDSIAETFSFYVPSGGEDTYEFRVSGLEYDTDYYVEIAPGAFEDLDGNPFEGIIDKSTWNFSTESDTTPTITVTTPDNANEEPNLYDILHVEGARWTSVASSRDGEIIVATGVNTNPEDQDSYIYVSNDGGDSWDMSLSVPEVFWTGIDMSADGQTLFAVGLDVYDDDAGAIIYRSDDEGEHWEEISSIPFGEWMGADVSFDEIFLALLLFTRIEVAEDLSHIYINMFNSVWSSTDQGETWDLALNLNEESGVVVSSVSATATGTLAIATTMAVFGGESDVYVSSNGGEDWVGSPIIEEDVQWFSSAISSDGTRFALTTFNDGGMYIFSEADGMVEVSNPDGFRWQYVRMASPDGMQMVGSAGYSDAEGAPHISLYTSDNGGLTWERQAILGVEAVSDITGVFVGNLTSSSDLSKLGLAVLTQLFVFNKQDLIDMPDPVVETSSGGGISTKQRILRKIDRLIENEDTVALQEYIAENKERLERYVRGGTKLPSSVIDLLSASDDVETAANVPTFVVRDLEFGMTGEDVLLLQKLLNGTVHPLAATGVGSAGNETAYFGALTRTALAKYQTANGILPTAGYFGPITRAQMKAAGLKGLWW